MMFSFGCFILLTAFVSLQQKKKYMVKTVIAFFGAFPLTIMVDVMRYIYQDWEFAKWICIAIVIDTLVSVVKHFIAKDFNSEDFWHKFAKKIFIYIVLLIASNMLNNYTVNGHVVGSTQWIGAYLCVFMLLRESVSIFENANAIMPIVPAWLLKRLKDFNDKGEYIKKNSEEE